MIVPLWSGPFSIKRNKLLLKIGTKCSFKAKKNLLFRIFHIERNFLFLNEWPRNRCSQWYCSSFIILVLFNRLRNNLFLSMRSLLEWLFLYAVTRNFGSQLITFLFLQRNVCSFLTLFLLWKIGSFLFTWGTIVPINRFRFERNVPFYWHVEQFVPNH